MIVLDDSQGSRDRFKNVLGEIKKEKMPVYFSLLKILRPDVPKIDVLWQTQVGLVSFWLGNIEEKIW